MIPGRVKKSAPKGMSVAKALTLFYLGSAVIITLSVSVVTFVSVRAIVEEEHREFTAHQVHEVKSAVYVFLGHRLSILRDYANFPILVQGVMHPGSNSANIADFLDGLGMLGSPKPFTLLDYRGDPIYAPGGAEEDYSALPWVGRIMAGAVSEYMGVAGKEGVFFWRIAVPVLYGGLAEGILLCEIPLLELEDELSLSKGLGKNSVEFISRGKVVFTAGNESAAAYEEHKLESPRLTLRFRWAEEGLNQAKKRLFIQTASIVILITLVSFIGAFYLSRRFFGIPLERFRGTTHRLVNDYEKVRAPEDLYLKELALLAADFNTMAEQVYERDRELRRARDGLEKKVAERTTAIRFELAERKKTEEKLRQSEMRWQFALEGSRDGIWDWNVETGEVFFSSMWKRMLLYEDHEIEHDLSEWDKRVHPDDRDATYADVNAHLEGKTDFYLNEHRLMCKDGRYRWILDRGMVIERTEEGKPLRFIGTHSDITERKRSEAELREARDRARSADRAKSEFLANMSHEIRTPMNAVLGFSELLLSLVSDPRQKKYIASIHGAGKSLLTIINDILDLSKIEAGMMSLQYGNTDLQRIIHEIEVVFEQRIGEKGISFIRETDPALPPFLLLDEIRIRQILLNLVGNAVKFTDRGHVKLSVAFSPLAGGGKGALTITVADTGMGIPEKQQQAMFDPFTQQEGQAALKYGGTGLGLTITRRLVEMMNGSIALKSEWGAGTVFEVVIGDVEICEDGAGGEKSESASRLAEVWFEPARVLVVDDIASNRELIEGALQGKGLTVVTAVNGREAVEAAVEHPPDLVLMDIRMPVMDGYEATARIKENPATGGVPVIALTASLTVEEKAAIKGAGFDAYLFKPVGMPLLLCEMARFLSCSVKEPGAGETTAPSEAGGAPVEGREALSICLEREMLPRWRGFQGALEMDAVVEFARHLGELAARHRAPALKSYAEALGEAAGNFDIVGIQERLDRFPEWVDGLKGDAK